MAEQAQCPEPTAAELSRLGKQRKFIRQVLILAGSYWNCDRKARARGATLLLLLLTIGQVALTVWGNYWQRALYDALEQHSVRGVVIQIGVFLIILASSIAVTAAHLMVKRFIQVDWRSWLTERLLVNWMGEGRHYRLLSSPGDHDNPDQRIAEDIRIATESAIGLAHSLTYSILTLGLFVNILWNVSGSINVPGTSVHIPGYMVPLAFVYAILGSSFGWMVGRPLVRSTNALQNAEATFRFGLSRARENAESIALLRGEPVERAASAVRFRQIVRSWNRQSFAFLGLLSFGTAYGSLLPVLPILVAAPQYVQGAMTLGALMQAAQAFERLTSSLSWPVDNLGALATCRASADRVLALHADLLQLQDKDAETEHPTILVERTEGDKLVVQDVCIAEPSGRLLIEHLDLEVRRGERVFITGDPGVTESLFKAVGGLWPWGCGRVALPGDGEMFFLAQRPFLPEGSLRESISYPRPADAFDDAAMLRAMESVGLSRLVPRLDERGNWEQALPQRVQQQLGFARVLLHRPAWIFLEEATDAFDPEGERLIMEMLRRELPDASLMTISFHPDLAGLHQRTVNLARLQDAKVLFGPRRAGNGVHPENDDADGDD
jgi:putative ATP-binding cassette transporter